MELGTTMSSVVLCIPDPHLTDRKAIKSSLDVISKCIICKTGILCLGVSMWKYPDSLRGKSISVIDLGYKICFKKAALYDCFTDSIYMYSTCTCTDIGCSLG